jgi:hypothetical protein
MASLDIHERGDPGVLLGEELANPPEPPQLEEGEPPHPLVGAECVVRKVGQHIGDEGAPQVSATRNIELSEDPDGAKLKSFALLGQ